MKLRIISLIAICAFISGCTSAPSPDASQISSVTMLFTIGEGGVPKDIIVTDYKGFSVERDQFEKEAIIALSKRRVKGVVGSRLPATITFTPEDAKANQAPEPTPTTVTPPAGQEARQP